MTAGAPSLRAEHLAKSYSGRRVVDDVSLDVTGGEIVGLLGPNGAGKTTTFYMVVGLVRPASGRVFLGTEDITDLPMYQRARRGVSYLPQEPSAVRKLTAEENLLAILETLELSRAERLERCDELLEEFGLERVRRTPAYALSGGERRRLEIARALVLSPGFLLLDEPFAGIDPIAVLDLQRLIAGLSRRRIGVLITDHNVRETLKIVGRAYIINEGRILRSGLPAELSEDELVRKIYLGEEFTLA